MVVALLRRVARVPVVRRHLLPLVRRRFSSGVIRGGEGAGLIIDTDGTNPGYLLGAAEPQIQAIVGQLGTRDVFLDVGANVGFFSLIAASRGARVTAIEPHPRAAGVLRRNAQQNALTIEVLELALSDHSGESFVAGDQHLTASLSNHGHRVNLARGDELELVDPTLVKIDVEGHEVAVLDGLTGLLERARPAVVVEIHGDTENACRERLSPLGYNFDLIADGGMPHLIARPAH